MVGRHRVAVAAALALAVLTLAVLVADGPLPGEVGLIEQFQRLGPPAPALADAVGATTGTEANLIVGAVAALALVRWHGRRALAAMAICLLAMLVVQPLSKEVVDRDRPGDTQVEVRTDHDSRSYPSGHSLSTATVWGLAAAHGWHVGRRRLAALLATPIGATAAASTIHGAHWASDIVAGTIIGLAGAGLALAQLEFSRLETTPTSA